MSISAGVGLFSGIDSASLIEQLLAVDAKPQILAQQRIIQLQQQQAAYLDVNSRLLSLKTLSGSFSLNKLFDSAKATSSNTAVLAATAGKDAAAGSYQFIVHRLVSTQQSISKGFTDSDTTGIGATEFTFETGGGSLEVDTALSELNGGAGVSRGVFTISDSTGDSVEVDLSTAVTIGDVLNSINAQTEVGVSAAIDGDRIVLKHDNPAASFTVTDAFGDQMAEDLGIAGSSTAGAITGTDIRYVSSGTALSLLNDGNGVHFALDAGTVDAEAFDIEIIVDSGGGNHSLRVSFGELVDPDGGPDGEEIVVKSAATTLGDIIKRINDAAAADADVDVTASINAEGTGITITDNSGAGNMTITSLSGRTTAEDLGIVAGAPVAGTQVVGTRVIASLNSTLMKSINGGAGLTASNMIFTARDGTAAVVSLGASALNGSMADVIASINAQLASAGADISVGLNSAGNGLEVADSSGGTGNLIVAGGAAAQLGIDTDPAGVAADTHQGKSAQQKWISLATKLTDLNGGKGIGTGTIRVTSADGVTQTLAIGSTLRTVDELIDFINASPIGSSVSASINANGDGIQFTDITGGTGDLVIEDESGTVAKSLNLAGTFEEDGGSIAANGSYEKVVEFSATDTLDQVVTKINNAGVGVTAAVLNDGSANAPFHLNLTAKASGSAGATIVDTGGLDLGFTSLSKGQDAVAFFGAKDPADAFLITSSTNTITGVVKGVTIDLESTSSAPVEVVVEHDLSPVTAKIGELIAAFNNVIAAIDTYDSYNAETEKKGILLGDQGVRNIKNRLLTMVQSKPSGVSTQFDYLFEVGIKLGEGNELEFDQEKFEQAFAQDPEGVEALLSASKLLPKEPIEIAPGVTVADTEDTYEQQGVFEQLEVLIEAFTNSIDGTITIKKNSFDTKIDQQKDRIEQLQKSLDSKRLVLQQQFLQMEQALAALSTQSQALATLG